VIPNIYIVVFATSSKTKEKIIQKTPYIHSFIKVNRPMKNMIQFELTDKTNVNTNIGLNKSFKINKTGKVN
jgi:hypothetical protein